MFERVVLRRSSRGPAISAGELAEALLFYQKVHLIVDFGSFGGLVRSVGAGNILSLIKEGMLSVTYMDETLCTMADSNALGSTYSLEAMTFLGNNQKYSRKNAMQTQLLRSGMSKSASKNFAERFRRHFAFTKMTGDHYIGGGITNAATFSLNDNKNVENAVKIIVESEVGSNFLPSDFKFNIQFSEEKKFNVSTNLDINKAESAYKSLHGNNSTFNISQILNEYLYAQGDLILCAHYGGDFFTSSLTGSLLEEKSKELFLKTKISNHQLLALQNVIFDESRQLREVIDSEEKSFSDFMKLLDKSRKFKSWLHSSNPDKQVVSEYIRAITSEGWLDKLPTKAIRFVIGNIWDLVEPISGKGFSVVDNFLLDKLAGGWKPNIFVDKHLKKFTGSID
jgi:hypothetical protein